MNFPSTIYEYVESEENSYRNGEVRLTDNWSWNMATHIKEAISLKHGKFLNSLFQTKNDNDDQIMPKQWYGLTRCVGRQV